MLHGAYKVVFVSPFRIGSIDANQVQIVPRPSNGDAETILKIDKKFGAMGYVYKGRINTVTNETSASSYVYINIDNSKAPYQFRALLAPSTSADLLKQVNEQGAKGFRLKAGLL